MPTRSRGNWLMNHRTYDAQRYSPLDKINKANVKSLKLAYAVAIGGTAVNENLESTPLAEDGYPLRRRSMGRGLQDRRPLRRLGRIVWRMDPGQEKTPLANRGVALWGNLVSASRAIRRASSPPTRRPVSPSGRPISPTARWTCSSPRRRLPVKDKIIIGAAGGDRGVRDFIAALDGATGKVVWRKYTVPAPGEPGSETWKDKNNAWQTGGGAMWVTGSYDSATNQVLWGTGNPVPMYNPYYRPGDNLYTNSLISWDPDTGKMNWYHQYTPGDMWDYDAAGTHILIDGQVGGAPHKMVVHPARNGFLYTFERTNGQTLHAKPYMEGDHLDQGHRPEDRHAGRLRSYKGHPGLFRRAGQTMTDRTKRLCPSHEGGNNYWSASYSPRTKLLYIPSRPTCDEVTMTPDQMQRAPPVPCSAAGSGSSRGPNPRSSSPILHR